MQASTLQYTRAGGERKQRKYKKEVDTNVVDIKFSVLQDQGVLGTGDPLFCQVCQSVFNMYSQTSVEPRGEGEVQQIWICEFCNAKNDVNIDEQEKPKSNAVNYILEAAAKQVGSDVEE